MIRFNRFNQRAALCALLLCFSLGSSADQIQEANTLFKRGQNADALAKVDAILSSQPKDAQARFLKALLIAEQGQTDDAIRLFTALTVDYPELPEPYNNLAVLYAGQGQYEKAKVALEKALRTHPSYATAHNNLGDIYAKMASQAYDRALQLDRNKTTPPTKLALIKDFSTGSANSGGKTQIASLVPARPPVATKPASTTPATVVVVSAPVAIASAPVMAVAPVIAKPAEVKVSSSNDEVLNAVNDWAKAWSSRNANKYLSMYAKDFKTPNNQSRSCWEKQRRERIGKPQPIAVSISNAKVKLLDDTHASVSFIQFYRSGALKSTTRKTLLMVKSNGSWQISAEQTGV